MSLSAAISNKIVVTLSSPKCSNQSGALSLVGRVEILLSSVESFIELKYFHDVAMPALLCHKEQARASKAPSKGLLTLLASRWFFMA